VDTVTLHTRLVDLLSLGSPPIAISFTSPPPGVARLERPLPSSCAYWRAAAEGRVFATVEGDHQGCPIGAHTHGAPLVPGELETMVGTMIELGYLCADDVAGIPTRREPFAGAVYAPLADAPVPPDVVLVRGAPRALMLLDEAARAAGAAPEAPPMGRPTCAALPLALSSGRPSLSLGCIGNRVYTGIPDGEAYLAVPASRLAQIVDRLETVVRANRELEAFHRARA
jgi:uncharacterized protein (DUF169 family)